MKLLHPVAVLGPRFALGAGVAALPVLFATFGAYTQPSNDTVRTAGVAVVFTGQFERVDAALRLLHRGLVRRVFISGLNAGAGIQPQTFIEQFSRRNPEIANLPALVACCVDWGVNANTTIQNADETACWLKQTNIAGPILLVTGRDHLARAALALRQSIGARQLILYPVSDSTVGEPYVKTRIIEALKFLGLAVAVHVPGYKSSALLHAQFARGCPSSFAAHSLTDSTRAE